MNATYPILVWDVSACAGRAGRSTVLVPLNGITPFLLGKGELYGQYGEALAEAATYEAIEEYHLAGISKEMAMPYNALSCLGANSRVITSISSHRFVDRAV